MHPVADTIASLAPARGALHGADAQRRAFGSAQRQHARRFEAAAPAPPRRTNPVQSSAAADISAAAGHSRCCVPLENAAASSGGREAADGCDAAPFGVSRRSALFSVTIVTVAAAAAGIRPQPAKAVQGLTAGRVPGVSGPPDEEGFLTYQRPEGKSGGHGVGWSEIPRYKFKIDLRYAGDNEGELSVVVAPVLRFLDVGFNANVRIEDVGPPEKLISGFAPELFGVPIAEEDVVETASVSKDGCSYYQWEVDIKAAARPHHLVSATAVGNRVFIMTVAANGRQWRRAQPKLRRIQETFWVPPKMA